MLTVIDALGVITTLKGKGGGLEKRVGTVPKKSVIKYLMAGWPKGMAAIVILFV